MYAVRHPRIGDPVIHWHDRGTIVQLRAGYAHADFDDDLRVTVPTDRLRWDPVFSVWLVLAPEPVQPAWLHEDPDFTDHPTDAKAFGR